MDIGKWLKNLFVGSNKKVISAAYNGMNSYGGFKSDGSKYPYGISGSGVGMLLDHRTLRQNARTAYHQTLPAHAMVQRWTEIVVGKGLKLEPTPYFDLLGMNPEQAELWSEDVAKKFDMWARSKQSIRSETMNFYQATRLAEISQQRDNDYFVRFYYSKDRNLQNPLQIDFIDPEQIQGSGYTATFNPTYLGQYDDGILRDAGGKEIAYKIWLTKSNGKKEFVEIPAILPNGRRLISHGYYQEYAGQGRGYTLFAHSLQDLQHYTDFSLSEILKAINQSQIWAQQIPNADNAASDPLAELNLGIGANTDGNLAPIPDSADQSPAVTVSPIYEKAITQPGGLFITTNANGERMEPFANTAPSEGYSAFMDSFLTSYYSSGSMAPEVGKLEFDSSFSAARAALLMVWEVGKIWREELATDFLMPIYEMWLSGEIAAGRIRAPGWNDPRMRAAWLACNWIGPALPNIDPLKAALGIEKHLQMGLTTQQREAQELNGSSAKANNAKNAREFQGTPQVPWAKESQRKNGDKEEPSEKEDKENG